MKQVFRRVVDRKGRIVVEEVPVPAIGDFDVLIDTRASVISTGTELATLNKTLPELVRQTLSDPWMRQAVKQVMASGGLLNTADRVHDELIALRVVGYSGSGIVAGTGGRVTSVKAGDRVAFAGCGHAEVARVSRNQCVAVPQEVGFHEAAFATIGAIALQGVRRAGVEIGERVAVIGLGLVGQLVVQLVRAAGADCIAIEPSAQRRELAKSLGLQTAIDPSEGTAVDQVLARTGRQGADRVLICASGQDPKIANDALKMCRQQGRVTVVGIVPMNLERMPFFLKELDFVFSRAYGPGPFDADWESGRSEYAPHYVRWDAKRNMQAFLQQVASGRVQVEPLISGRYPIEDAQQAYADISGETMASVLVYDANDEASMTRRRIEIPGTRKKCRTSAANTLKIGLIGSGSHTRRVLLPALGAMRDVSIKAIAASTGTNSLPMAKKYGTDYVTSDAEDIFDDPEIDAVIIGTRHDLHASMVKSALEAGKHVLVEKPLALDVADCLAIAELADETGLHCIVGHNRRYAPLTRFLLDQRPSDAPAFMQYLVAIRPVPADHWTLNGTEGGGRLLGEADHFFDMLNLFAASRPTSVHATAWQADGQPMHEVCNFTVQIHYENGSTGIVQYTDQASARVPRERLEVTCGGSVLRLTDYGEAEVLASRRKRKKQRPDFGHKAELRNFVDTILGRTEPWATIEDGVEATVVAQAAMGSLRSGMTIDLNARRQFLSAIRTETTKEH